MLSIFKEELKAFLFIIVMYTDLFTLEVNLFHWNHFSGSKATSFAISRSEQ